MQQVDRFMDSDNDDIQLVEALDGFLLMVKCSSKLKPTIVKTLKKTEKLIKKILEQDNERTKEAVKKGD